MQNTAKQSSQRYFTMWRWHFYAGIFVAPLLMVLAATGLAMIFFAHTVGREGDLQPVAVSGQPLPLSVQSARVLEQVDPQGQLIQYFKPRAADKVAIFRLEKGDGTALMAALNPYSGEVLKTFPRNKSAYHLMDEIHSDLLLGTVGDYLLETAAALTVLLILTGYYLWWASRQRRVSQMFSSGGLERGRNGWRKLHGLCGTYISLMLLLFCLSGMAWAGIWGGKMVQAWSQFPAGKWGVAPEPASQLRTHGDLNEGKTKELPWALELTALPHSGTEAGMAGLKAGEEINLENIDRLARDLGFKDRYQIYFPRGETGIWTINQDSMSYDSPSPTADRTVHIDRYSGKILADISFADYNWFGKFMAASLAFHMGTMGAWSVALNVIFCLAVIFICISGYVMWWQRRPRGAGLAAPSLGETLPPWPRAAAFLLIIAAIFPTALVAILLVLLLDWLLLKRFKFFQRLLQ